MRIAAKSSQINVPGGECNAQGISGLFTKYVYFADPSSPQDYYEASTRFVLTYPSKLHAALGAEGFQMFDANPVGSCGWTIADKVNKLSIDLAFIQHQGIALGNATSVARGASACVCEVRAR
jgi:hypothetical protein